MNLWRVYYKDGSSPCVFQSEESMVRFATGGFLGPVTESSGVQHAWPVDAIKMIEVHPMQQPPRGTPETE